MTKREAKAVELLKRHYPALDSRGFSDDELLTWKFTQTILEGMHWQSEECVLASGGLKGDQQMIAIRNAGTEDV